MAFKALFLAHAPDADYKKHNSVIDTGRYKLWSYAIKDQSEAVALAKDIYDKEKIDAVLLCPGFTHREVAELFEALGGKVSVSVSRGDGPSSRIIQPVIQREYYDR